jgi:hypothetical protein
VIERGLLTDQRMHATHAGRKLPVLDVQFDSHGKLPDVTLRAQVARAGEAQRTDDRQKGFGTDFLVSGLMPTGARQPTLVGSRSFELQQLA